MKNYFRCPICKKNVEVGEWGKLDSGGKEFRLMNKRYHMVCHRESKLEKRKAERKISRTALVDGTG